MAASETEHRTRVAVILAAGKGTRMRSSTPKVLHRVGGRPMIQWVAEAARQSGCELIVVVVGHGSEMVREAVSAADVRFVLQEEQLGTGHALAQAESAIAGPSTLLVLSGDVPLVSPSTLDALAAEAEAGWGAMAVAELEKPGSLGRVIAAEGDCLERIVEAADASPEELTCRLVNAGIYALPSEIFDDLRRLDPSNAQGEYYLTDALGAAAGRGDAVSLHRLEHFEEAFGVNDRRDLARVHRVLLDRHLEELMRGGVTILEPARTSIEPTVKVGADTVIHPEVSLEGETRIGEGVVLQQGVWMRNTRVGDGVLVKAYSLLEDAEVAPDCIVGPFARLRPAAVLLEGARVGNFVELKKTRLGKGSKVSHLTYLGDSEVGEQANIGAGVVTCNYDGKNKHRTTIGDGAFVGSDTMLVAPVSVGPGATTGAGSVITQDVPEGALAVGRARQRNIPDWKRRAGKAGKADKD
jgi:bifunctional UDP-N-acetylglucosamine pyrophosphorylase/glucosamine-1-phosphate N-acetyltransferase